MHYHDKPGGELKGHDLYGSDAVKIIILACVIILVSVVATGMLSYTVAKKAVLDKLKTRDLPLIVQSMSAKIDGRLQRAIETSLVLSSDQAVMEWVRGREVDQQLGRYAREKLLSLGRDYDYSTSFIVSSSTNNYWAEGGILLGKVSPDDPMDAWFYNILKSGERVVLNLDYNQQRQVTNVFVDTLMGDLENPLAVVGVGLSLEEIAAEFQESKFGVQSKLWLVDQQGKICLADQVSDVGKNISELLPPETGREILGNETARSSAPVVTEFTGARGELIDLVYQPLQSAGWTLMFQIPRDESLAVIKPIRFNTIVTVVIAAVLLMVIFFMVSRRIADPYKRALALNAELERQVGLRTQELKEKNEKIMDSIDYAKRIQEAMLPSSAEMDRMFKEHFVLWRPRDVVGGDFYWGREFSHGRLLIVGDCTGHGVPGALMTMAVISMLDHIVTNISQNDPALIIRELNRLLRGALQGDREQIRLDDGLDAGVCYIARDGQFLYAGAKIALYQAGRQGLRVYKGMNRSIGCRTPPEYLAVDNQIVACEAGDAFYLSTDGYLDQNGGEKNYSFGTKRYRALLAGCGAMNMDGQYRYFEEKLLSYMQGEEQRDDVTVLGFRL